MDVVGILKRFVQLDNMRMVQLFHDSYFPLEAVDILDRVFGDRLDGIHCAGAFICCLGSAAAKP